MSKYVQGVYQLKNPKKYKGDPSKVFFRSSYELKYFMYLDATKEIIQWSSEEIAIPYRSIDGKMHRYYVDIWQKVQESNNKFQEYLIEIKPSSQTKPPNMKRKKTKDLMEEIMTYEINQCKWKAAKEFCNKYNMVFMILTEKELFSKAK